jgi:hypothetical protein
LDGLDTENRIKGNTTLVVGLFLWRMAYFRYSAKLVDPGQDRKTR